MTAVIDIGFGVTISRYTTGEPSVFGGVIIEHEASEQCLYKGTNFGASTETRCCGSVPVIQIFNRPKWTVMSEEPLTLSPSIECECKGFHGHIVDGLWVPC